MLNRFLFLTGLSSGLMLVASCAPPEQAVTQQAPAAAAPVQAAPAAVEPADPPGSWIDWPITPGNWVYRQDASGSLALFGAANQDAIVTLRCNKQRQRIYLTRAGNGASAPMTIRTSARLKEATALSTGGTPAYLAVELSPDDPILDAMAYSRGRMAIQAGGTRSVAVPVWSEIGRIIDDCR